MMMKNTTYLLAIMLFVSCFEDDSLQGVLTSPDSSDLVISCDNAMYGPWQASEYVLPYTVGETYNVDLNQCSSSYHAPGKPDQFAVDFFMPIGTPIRASRSGTVTFVEESGLDYEFPNNKIIIESGGNFDQYMHLTKDGALVEEGQNVSQGQLIGYSGATGLAGYPHLHFVVTTDGWEWPYISIPHNFRNTIENQRGPESNTAYEALPY